MLCPDMWNLPQPKYSYEANSFKRHIIEKKVSSGNFCEYITIVIPGDFPHPESAENALRGSDSYTVKELPLTEFLEPEFIEGFAKRGKFYGLSLKQDNEADCCVALTPNGYLSIAVNRDTFESIQLTGKPIQTSRKSKDRYREYFNVSCMKVARRKSLEIVRKMYLFSASMQEMVQFYE
ncbi:uncharacterized protein LOC132262209 [Phlebotomus argentipes]|uniref:uncharacterized protein LOC132262209 n=1 Tax=Phlebotomus argentipes TaxID=94469 RepID=UPI002892DC84|nr:uncharacterized protein LOC132262209 [Phlebotomus argentipes]